MPIKDVFKVNRKTFINPAAWLGYDNVKDSSTMLWQSAKLVFFSAPTVPAVQGETFDQAVKRLNLSDTDLKTILETYLIFTSFFAGIGILLICYCIWLWSRGHFADGVIALAIATYTFGQAFVFNFWRFQIKWRKLGCTFEEWRHGKPHDEGTA